MGRYWFRSTLSRSPIADRRSPIADRRSPIADRIARIFTYPLTVPAPEEAPRNRKGAEGFGVQRSRAWRGTLDHALSLRRTTHDARRSATQHEGARCDETPPRPLSVSNLPRNPAFFCAFAPPRFLGRFLGPLGWTGHDPSGTRGARRPFDGVLGRSRHPNAVTRAARPSQSSRFTATHRDMVGAQTERSVMEETISKNMKSVYTVVDRGQGKSTWVRVGVGF